MRMEIKNQDKIILKPYDRITKFFFILEGIVDVCYPDETKFFDVVDNYISYIGAKK